MISSKPASDGDTFLSKIGASVRLLEECRQLAAVLELPDDIYPDDDERWEASVEHLDDGPPWRPYGVEAFCVVRLIRGCEASIRLGAALAYV